MKFSGTLVLIAALQLANTAPITEAEPALSLQERQSPDLGTYVYFKKDAIPAEEMEKRQSPDLGTYVYF
jgi:hypothetical protein